MPKHRQKQTTPYTVGAETQGTYQVGAESRAGYFMGASNATEADTSMQWYLAHKKQPTSLGTPQDPR